MGAVLNGLKKGIKFFGKSFLILCPPILHVIILALCPFGIVLAWRWATGNPTTKELDESLVRGEQVLAVLKSTDGKKKIYDSSKSRRQNDEINRKAA